MEPQDLADVMEAVIDCALAAGMDPDVAEVTVSFDKTTGDAAVKSTSGAGKAFECSCPAADIAAALDADMAEDAGGMDMAPPAAKSVPGADAGAAA